MFSLKNLMVLAAALGLGACGGDSSPTSTTATSTAHGTLSVNPPFRIASLTAAALQANLAANTTGVELLALTGAPTCGVDFYYIRFWTVGGNGETTESSGALMVPTGAAGTCTGARPIVEYAHGTNPLKTLNIADVTNAGNTEGLLIAAMFAAQGYIVVAPNYAGYDISTLGYHPFLNAAQQSGEMMDILTAARTALPNTMSAATSDSGKLFLTGYSEGGHVAMATQRAMIAAGQTVTAAAPMSGPYALEALADAIFYGNVDIGSTVFAPLLSTSYQHAYGNIYSATTDLYSSTYASGIDTLLPSATPVDTLFAENLLPETYLFDSSTPTVTVPGNAALSAALTAALAIPSGTTNPLTPVFDAGFGEPPLINNSYRVAYILDAAQNPDGAVPTPTAAAARAAVAPTQPLRLAVYQNDLRTAWAPNSPTLLCGGDEDPTVFFSVNTQTMAAFWAALPAGVVTVLDVNATPAGPFAAIQGAFQQSQAAQLAALVASGMSTTAAQTTLIENYHSAVAPFCSLAARSFFSQF